MISLIQHSFSPSNKFVFSFYTVKLSFYTVKFSFKKRYFSSSEDHVFWLWFIIYASHLLLMCYSFYTRHLPFERKMQLHHPDLFLVDTVFRVHEILVFCGIHFEAPFLWKQMAGRLQTTQAFLFCGRAVCTCLILNSEVQMSCNKSISSYLNVVKYGNLA